ncbi:MAG: DUF721 domain-containing protein [bacterium]
MTFNLPRGHPPASRSAKMTPKKRAELGSKVPLRNGTHCTFLCRQRDSRHGRRRGGPCRRHGADRWRLGSMSSPFYDLLRDAWESSGRTPTLSLYRSCWEVLVGAELAKHTRPVSLAGDRLQVEVRRSWAPEITRRSDELRKRMEPRLPFVPPTLDIIASDDFAALTVAKVSAPVIPRDERTQGLPDGTRELAEQILWHIRKESE